MRALARYIMKGRVEATIVAVLSVGSVLFAWLGGATVALVTLCRGSKQSSYVLLWALLPAVLLMSFGDISPLAVLLGSMASAIVLRTYLGWPFALMVAVLTGLAVSIWLLTFGQASIESMTEAFAYILAKLLGDSNDPLSAIQLPNALQVAGLLGFGQAVTVGFCLVLARWWQASLYHPGQFAREFQAFRMPVLLTIVLLITGLSLWAIGRDFALWALILMVPFIFSGFGLAHAIAAKKTLKRYWLILFYLAWLLLDPLKILLLLAAIMDSWINFRARLSKS